MKQMDAWAVWRRMTIGLVFLFPFTANSDPIIVSEVSGSDDGGMVDGYTMTDFAPISDGLVICLDSPTSEGGKMCFEDKDGNALAMLSTDAYQDGNGWWEFDHGNILATSINWIEIILPQDTRALSFWVGATMNGYAWLQAFDSQGNDSGIVNFNVGPGTTSGFGTAGYSVSVADSCNSISRIIVDPFMWGVGNFSINQGSCVSVPEPGTLGLLASALLGFALFRRRLRLG